MKISKILLSIFISFLIVAPALATVQLPNPLGEEVNPNVLIGKVIQAILGIVGSLALLMFIYGGLTWMMAAGNNERIQKGKEILIWATIGLIVIFSAYAFIRFIFEGLGVN